MILQSRDQKGGAEVDTPETFLGCAVVHQPQEVIECYLQLSKTQYAQNYRGSNVNIYA